MEKLRWLLLSTPEYQSLSNFLNVLIWVSLYLYTSLSHYYECEGAVNRFFNWHLLSLTSKNVTLVSKPIWMFMMNPDELWLCCSYCESSLKSVSVNLLVWLQIILRGVISKLWCSCIAMLLIQFRYLLEQRSPRLLIIDNSQDLKDFLLSIAKKTPICLFTLG